MWQGYLIALLFTGFWCLHDNYAIKDSVDDASLKRKRKVWKGALQLLFLYMDYLLFGWKIALFTGAFYWLDFDAYINLVVLHEPLSYEGSTSVTDSVMSKLGPRLRTGIKIAFLAASIAVLIWT